MHTFLRGARKGNVKDIGCQSPLGAENRTGNPNTLNDKEQRNGNKHG
jgi:hypothetical protein